MWIVIISVSGGYECHSFHKTKEVAVEWARCKSSDGDDVSILHLNKDRVGELEDFILRLEK